MVVRQLILDAIEDYYAQTHEPKKFRPGIDIVPVSGPKIFPKDVAYVADALLDGWFTEWKECAKFERLLCAYTGMKHCVLVSSGSSANLIAVTACIQKYFGYNKLNKDYFSVITCSTGFPTTTYPIIQNGYKPLFVDFDPATLNPCLDQVLGAMGGIGLRRETVIMGIILAHSLGFPFDEEEMIKEAHDRGQFVIIDACDALGAKINGKHVGSEADCMTLSFFPAHHITTGEGGAILTNDDELAKLIRRLVNWGRDCDCLPGQSNTCGTRFTKQYGKLPLGYDHKYTFSEIGYNLKMTELSGALGVAQMGHIDEFVKARQDNFRYLAENDSTIQWYFNDHILAIQLQGTISPFGFPILLKKKHFAQGLARYLDEYKIQSRPIFTGNILKQPVADKLFYKKCCEEMKGSDYIMNHALWIGLHPALDREMLDYSVEVLTRYFNE